MRQDRWLRLVMVLGRLGLCAAYLQGGLNKLLDWPSALAEAEHFGLPIPSVAAAATIMTELLGSGLVLLGRGVWRVAGALWLAGFTLVASLVANRFWEMPVGPARFMAANGFFEHLGLVGGFLLVAALAWAARAR